MLTATYSIVAIAAEQESARGALTRLQQCIQAAWKGLQNIDFSFLENTLNQLTQFEKRCRNRKLETYLIPVLRNTSREADTLIAELDALSARATAIFWSLRERFVTAYDISSGRAGELCHAVETYCNNMFIRLDKEDRELLPLARRVLSVEQWFSIAAQLLADEADLYGRRGRTSGSRKPAPPSLPQRLNLH